MQSEISGLKQELTMQKSITTAATSKIGMVDMATSEVYNFTAGPSQSNTIQS